MKFRRVHNTAYAVVVTDSVNFSVMGISIVNYKSYIYLK
jgi:hypothetical protein